MAENFGYFFIIVWVIVFGLWLFFAFKPFRPKLDSSAVFYLNADGFLVSWHVSTNMPPLRGWIREAGSK
jgi:hypothetical protein